jgi:hypothetical protein
MNPRYLAGMAAVAMVATGVPALAGGIHARHDSPAGTIRFDTATVVDPFRPGFEPDVSVDPTTDATFDSMPNGFSTTISYVYRSDDHRQSFHLVEGQALGKPVTCVGGGDSDLRVDPVDHAVYFVDLQGLTNISASVSTDEGRTWSTNCTSVDATGTDRMWLAEDTNAGHDAVAPGASGGRLYMDWDNVAQNTATYQQGANFGGNELVMAESTDGVHFGGDCQPDVQCLPPAVISRTEGIPGNIVVDNTGGPRDHTIYAVHTNNAGDAVIVSRCSGSSTDHTANQVAADCTDPLESVPTESGFARVNKFWHDTYPRVPGPWNTGHDFASIAIDSAGNLYVVWSEYPVNKSGTVDGPGAIKLSVSTDGAQTWSKPITISPAGLNNNVMPWIVAGSPGRIDVAWYGAPQLSYQGQYGPDTLNDGVWNVYLAQSLNATAAAPAFQVVKVTDHPNKFGNISTQGLGGSPDRSLGDFMEVTTGPQGQAVISYVDDTSADRNPDSCGGCGQTPPEAAGPTMIATQDAGPSLFAGDTVPAGLDATNRNAPGSPVTVSDTNTGDAYYSGLGEQIPAAANQTIKGVSVSQTTSSTGAKELRVSMTMADPSLAKNLSVRPDMGGPVAEWLVRWAAPDYTAPGDGNIFYVGMESVEGGAPVFYTGTTNAIDTTHVKYFTYPATTAIPGSTKGGTITWIVPFADIGNPPSGAGLFSVTGFTATQLYSSTGPTVSTPNGGQAGDENIPNLIEAAPPLDFYVK